jgi:hypothetical protein
VDSKLAICGRRNIPLQAICIDIAGYSYLSACLVRNNSVVKAIKTIPLRNHQLNLQPSIPSKTSTDLGKSDSQIHLDHYSLSQCDWYALRKIAALPILFLDCVGNSCSSLACWISSFLAVCSVGCARIRLECVSQHKLQLDGCGASPRCDGCRRMVRNKKRSHRRCDRKTPTCRVASPKSRSVIRRVLQITHLQSPKEASFQHYSPPHQNHPHQHKKSSAQTP